MQIPSFVAPPPPPSASERASDPAQRPVDDRDFETALARAEQRRAHTAEHRQGSEPAAHDGSADRPDAEGFEPAGPGQPRRDETATNTSPAAAALAAVALGREIAGAVRGIGQIVAAAVASEHSAVATATTEVGLAPADDAPVGAAAPSTPPVTSGADLATPMPTDPAPATGTHVAPTDGAATDVAPTDGATTDAAATEGAATDGAPEVPAAPPGPPDAADADADDDRGPRQLNAATRPAGIPEQAHASDRARAVTSSPVPPGRPDATGAVIETPTGEHPHQIHDPASRAPSMSHPPSAMEPASTVDASSTSMPVVSPPVAGPTPGPQAATSTPQATPTVPVPASQIAEVVRDAATHLRRTGDDTWQLTVRLDPPELGPVRLELTARGHGVHLTMSAENPAGAGALEQQRHNIVRMLEAAGFNLDGFDVGGNHDERHTPDTDQDSQAARLTEAMLAELAELDDDAVVLPEGLRL